MAAPTTCTSSGSEEEEEALARLREAAWDPGRPSEAALLSPAAGPSRERKVPAAESSLRTKIHDHSQDGNELQTTPEFRAHVAKKLEAILDSSITTSECPLQTPQKNLDLSEMDNDGFRLFSSSVPGDCGRPESLPRGRRRPRNSSSSSSGDQEWQKFQEAAVSGAEILKQGSLPRGLQGSREDPSCRIDETSLKKAKKKRKRKEEEEEVEGVEGEESAGEGAIESTCSTLNGTCKGDDTAEVEGAVKKRKRKKRRRRKEEPGWKDDSTATSCQ